MQISGILGAVTAGAFAVGTAAVWPNSPPIDLRSIEYDPVNHVFSIDRFVRSKSPIYAPFSLLTVDAATERRVKECTYSETADFGPYEMERQSWPMEKIAGPDCIGALRSGNSYYIIMSVTPLEGPPDVERTETFTIQETK